MTAYLVSPAGTSVELFANVGGSGQNFTNTTLSDQAGTSIATAAAPFTGTFQPQGVLGTFDGGQPNGTWTLQINNDWNTDSGTLNSWSLSLASAEPERGDRRRRQLRNLQPAERDLPGGPRAAVGLDGHQSLSGVQPVTISNGDIVSNVDFVTTEGTASQPPMLGGIETTPLVYTQGDPATDITSALTVSDAENSNLIGATVWISDYQNGQDLLGFANTAKITGSWNAATGILTLSGSDTLADYQAALRAVTYQDTSPNPNSATRTVSFEANDGLGDSNVVARYIVWQIPNPAEMTVQIGSGPTAIVADRGTSATLAVWIMDSAQGLQSADLTITYDTSRFTVAESGVTASTYVANLGWTVTSTVDSAAGTIAVTLSGGTALPAGPAELVDLTFQVLATAIGGDSPLVLVVSGGAASQLNGGSVAVTPVDGNLAVFATDTWNGSTTGNLSDPANWVSGVAPSTAGDDLVLGVPGFGPPTPSSLVNDYPAGTLFHSLTLDGGCTLSGNSALLDSTGSATILSQDGNTLSLPLVLAADGTFEDSWGSLAVEGPLDNAGHLLTIDAESYTTATIDGAISGSGGLVMSGGGKLVLTAQNDYSGGTTVLAGTLQVTSSGALPSGTALIVGSGAELLFGSSAAGPSQFVAAPASPATVVAQPSSPAEAPAAVANTSNLPAEPAGPPFSAAIVQPASSLAVTGPSQMATEAVRPEASALLPPAPRSPQVRTAISPRTAGVGRIANLSPFRPLGKGPHAADLPRPTISPAAWAVFGEQSPAGCQANDRFTLTAAMVDLVLSQRNC